MRSPDPIHFNGDHVIAVSRRISVGQRVTMVYTIKMGYTIKMCYTPFRGSSRHEGRAELFEVHNQGFGLQALTG